MRGGGRVFRCGGSTATAAGSDGRSCAASTQASCRWQLVGFVPVNGRRSISSGLLHFLRFDHRLCPYCTGGSDEGFGICVRDNALTTAGPGAKSETALVFVGFPVKKESVNKSEIDIINVQNFSTEPFKSMVGNL